jgi:divalent metal cation (Fe/Co/Zn/Cd) transporter
MPTPSDLLRHGLRLEYATLSWNVVGTVVVLSAAVSARSVALAGFGLDSLIEILASTVVVWHLRSVAADRERPALRVLGAAFLALAVYVSVAAVLTLARHHEPGVSPVGIAWTAVTFAVMVLLASAKRRTGAALGNRVLLTESRVTLIDAYLAGAVLIGLVLNVAGLWWADPAAGFVIVGYAIKEGRAALKEAAA